MPLSLSQSQYTAVQQEQRQQHGLSLYQRARLEVLQKNSLELKAQIKNALLENPILQESLDSVVSLDEIPQDEWRRQRAEAEADGDGKEYAETRLADIVENQAAFDSGRLVSKADRASEDPEAAERRDYAMSLLTSQSSLYALVVEAIHSDIEGEARLISKCEFLAAQMNADGYIPFSDEELAADAKCTKEEIAEARAAIQSLDPPGLGARNLRECILLQLERAHRRGSLEWRLVDGGHLENLAAGRIGVIADALDCEEYEVLDAQEELRHGVDPHPGWQVKPPQAAPLVVPDLFVSRSVGGWKVSTNRQMLPRLECNPEYLEMANQGTLNDEDRQWFKRKITEAQQLVQHIEDRADTLERMGWYLLLHQKGAFEAGKLAELVPLTQAECARELDFSPSTISRIVRDKYLWSPGMGTVKLQDFFVNGYIRDDGTEVSTLKVRQRLQQLFAAEEPGRPLADDAVAEMLRDEGLPISRRAVTKYRLQAGIPSSFERRRTVPSSRKAAMS